MKKKIPFVLLAMALLVVCSVFTVATVRAEGTNYFSGVGIVVKQAGYGNTYIRSQDITQHDDGRDLYLIDKIAYYTGDNLPDSVEISFDGIVNGASVYISSNGVEERYLSGAVTKPLTSATLNFRIIVVNSFGGRQTIDINLGFVHVNGSMFFEGGSGTAADPFRISKPEHLDNMRLFLNSHFVLTDDIDLAGYRCRNNEIYPNPATDDGFRGMGTNEYYAFGGTLSGQSGDSALGTFRKYSIKNLSLNDNSLFNYANGASFDGISIGANRAEPAAAHLKTVNTPSGILARFAKNCTFTNLDVHAYISAGSAAAALVSQAEYTAVSANKIVASNIVVNLDTEARDSDVAICGVFNSVNYSGIMGNVILQNVAVNGTIYGGAGTAGIAGTAANIVLEQGYFDGEIFLGGTSVAAGSGGFIGTAAGGVRIESGFVDIEMSRTRVAAGEGNFGGLIGRAAAAVEIGGSFTSVAGNIKAAGLNNIGGLVGSAESTLTVRGCTNLSFGSFTAANCSGGFAGKVADEMTVAGNGGDTAVVMIDSVNAGQAFGGVAGETGGRLILGYVVVNIGTIRGAGSLGGIAGRNADGVSLGHDVNVVIGVITGTGDYVGGVIGQGAYGRELTETNLDDCTVDMGFGLHVGSVDGRSYVGGFAGRGAAEMSSAPILKICSVTSSVTGSGDYLGGFAGEFYGDVANTYLTVNVKSTANGSYVGGFAGSFAGAADNIRISGNIKGSDYVGGFAGQIIGVPDSVGARDYIIMNIEIGQKTIIAADGGFGGGFAGRMSGGYIYGGNIQAGATLNVAGDNVGGALGAMSGGIISHFDSHINVTGGKNTGGLAGYFSGGSILQCTVNGNVTGRSDRVGGLAGYATGNEDNKAVIGAGNTVTGNITAGSADANANKVGGFAGETSRYTEIGLGNSFNGNVRAGGQYIGGFIGYNQSNVTGVSINAIVNGAALTQGAEPSATYVGLFAGYSAGDIGSDINIKNSCAIINANDFVGGFVGELAGGTVGGTEAQPLVFERPVYTAGGCAGGLAAKMTGGTVCYVQVQGTVAVGGRVIRAGGIIGEMTGGSLENCTAAGSAAVTASFGGGSPGGGFNAEGLIGGIVGEANLNGENDDIAKFKNVTSYNTVEITVSPGFLAQGSVTMGGFAGRISNADVGDGCAAYGDVIISAEGFACTVGGFAGEIGYFNNREYGKTTKIAAGTKVYGNVASSRNNSTAQYFGGFAGINRGRIMANCETYGSLLCRAGGGWAGGFVGYNTGSIAGGCIAQGQLVTRAEGNCNVGGFVGYSSGNIDISTCRYLGGKAIRGALTGGFAASLAGGAYDGGGIYGYGADSESVYLGSDDMQPQAFDIDISVSGTVAGGFAGSISGNTVLKNIITRGTVTAYGVNPDCGGLVGQMNGGSVENCSAESTAKVTATGTDYVFGAGGLIGAINTGEYVKNCQTRNSVFVSATGQGYMAGGLTGFAGSIRIDDCSTEGMLVCSGGNVGYAGGLAGVIAARADGYASFYFNTKAILGDNNISKMRLEVSSGNIYAGGMAGYSLGATGDNNKAYGDVRTESGGSAGGFFGETHGIIGINNTAFGKVYGGGGAGGFAGVIGGQLTLAPNDFSTNKYCGGYVQGQNAAGYACIFSAGIINGKPVENLVEIPAENSGLSKSGYDVTVAGTYSAAGLIGFMSGGEIKNADIKVDIYGGTAKSYARDYWCDIGVAGFVGTMTDGYIENCGVTDSKVFSGKAQGYTGGFAGNLSFGAENIAQRIVNCASVAEITVSDRLGLDDDSGSAYDTDIFSAAGGFAGAITNAMVTGCSAEGSVFIDRIANKAFTSTSQNNYGSPFGRAGGFVCDISYASIVTDSTARVDIEIAPRVNPNSTEYFCTVAAAGGFVAQNKGRISGCTAYGNIDISEGVAGGFVGINSPGSLPERIIASCTSYGDVTIDLDGCSAAGGFAGKNNTQAVIDGGHILGCVSLGNIYAKSGTSSPMVGGFIGFSAGDEYSIMDCYAFGLPRGPVFGEDYNATAFVHTCEEFTELSNNNYFLETGTHFDDAGRFTPFTLNFDGTPKHLAAGEILNISDDSGAFTAVVTGRAVTANANTVTAGDEAGSAVVTVQLAVALYDIYGSSDGVRLINLFDNVIYVSSPWVDFAIDATIENGDTLKAGETAVINATGGVEGGRINWLYELYDDASVSYKTITEAQFRALVDTVYSLNSLEITVREDIPAAFRLRITAMPALDSALYAQIELWVEPKECPEEIRVNPSAYYDISGSGDYALTLTQYAAYDLGIDVTNFAGDYAGYKGYTVQITGPARFEDGRLIASSDTGSGVITITADVFRADGTPLTISIDYIVYGLATGITVYSGRAGNAMDSASAAFGQTLQFAFVLTGSTLNPIIEGVSIRVVSGIADLSGDGGYNNGVWMVGAMNVNRQAVDIRFLSSGSVVLKITSLDGNVTRYFTVEVASAVPNAAGADAFKIKTNGYTLDEWTDGDVTLSAGGGLGDLGEYLELRYWDGSQWSVFNSLTYSASGIYILKLRYFEKETGVYGGEFACVIKIRGAALIADDISWREIETLSGIILILDRVGSVSGEVLYEYRVNGGPRQILPDSMQVEIGFEDEVTFFIQRGEDAAEVSKTYTGSGIAAAEATLTVTPGTGFVSGEWTSKRVIFYLSAFSTGGAIAGLVYQYNVVGLGQAANDIWTDIDGAFFEIEESTEAIYTFRAVRKTGTTVITLGAASVSAPYTVRADYSDPDIIPSVPDVWTEGSVGINASLAITEPFSGIKSLKLYFEGGSGDGENLLGGYIAGSGSLALVLRQNGAYTVVMIDNAGREAARTFTVSKLIFGDINDFTVTGNPTEWASRAELMLSTTRTDIVKAEYSVNNGSTWTDITASYPYFTATVNGTYIFRITDSGFVSSYGSENGRKTSAPVVVNKIDMTPPTLNLLYNNAVWSPGGTTVWISAITGVSGTRSLVVTANYGAVSIDLTGQDSYLIHERGIYTFTLTNGAGVSAFKTVSITNIDTSAALTVDVDVDESLLRNWTNEPIVFLLSVAENNIIAPIVYYYRTYTDGVGYSEWTAIAGTRLAITRNVNAYYSFKAQTAAGLVSEPSRDYHVMSDFAAPVLTVDADWSVKGYVTFTVSSPGTLCGYAVEYAPYGTQNWVKMEGGEHTFEIPAAETGYWFRITTVAGSQSISREYRIGREEIESVDMANISISYDTAYGMRAIYDVWQDSGIITLNNSAEGVSGTVYQYAYDDKPWTTMKGDMLNIADLIRAGLPAGEKDLGGSIEAVFRFRAKPGAAEQWPDEFMITDGFVMVDTRLGMEIIDAERIKDGKLNYVAADIILELNVLYGASGIPSLMVEYPGMYGTYFRLNWDTARFTVKENGTYRFTLISAVNVKRVFEYTVDRIDRAHPVFSVAVTGDTDVWTSEYVHFMIYNIAEQVSGLTFYCVIDGDEYEMTEEQLNKGVKIDENTEALYWFTARSGAGETTDSRRFMVKIDRGAPPLTATGNRTYWSKDDVVLTVEGTFGGSGGHMEYSLDGTEWVAFGNAFTTGGNHTNNFTVEANGAYFFRSVAGNGSKSDPYRVDVTRIDKTLPIITENWAAGQILRKNVTVTAEDFYSYEILLNSKVLTGVTLRHGEQATFTKNGTYTIKYYSEGGNLVEITFTISKPNYVLLFGLGTGVLMMIIVIIVLLILYSRNRRALKRLIAASTASDEPNKFVMFKRVK